MSETKEIDDGSPGSHPHRHWRCSFPIRFRIHRVSKLATSRIRPCPRQAFIALSRRARVARMGSCGPLLATHFLFGKQIDLPFVLHHTINSQSSRHTSSIRPATCVTTGGTELIM